MRQMASQSFRLDKHDCGPGNCAFLCGSHNSGLQQAAGSHEGYSCLHCQSGPAVVKSLKEHLPFNQIQTDRTLDESNFELNRRSIAMIIVIPSDFSAKIQVSSQPQMKFYVNDSNGLVLNNMTKSVMNQVAATVKSQIISNKSAGMFEES